MSKHDLDSNTKTHGFTAWVNMRLTPFDLQLSDVFEELLNGSNMRSLVQSYTGNKDEKNNSLDGYIE